MAPALPRALVRGEGGGARVVGVCERARRAGVRIGMTAAEARARLPALSIATFEPARVEAIEASIIDALLQVSPRLGRTGALGGLAAPEGQPTSFQLRPALAPHDDFLLDLATPDDLERLSEVVRDLDLGPATLGVADGAFAAICAAHVVEPRRDDPSEPAAPRRKVVPRGGDASFLAPLSSALLPASPTALDAIRSLGLDSLALVAALPLEGIQARLGEEGRFLVGLARGHAPPALATYVPGADPSVEVDLVDADPTSDGASTLEPVLFALRAACGRLLPPLAARGTGLGEAEILLEGVRTRSTRIVLRPARPELDPLALFELARATLEGTFRAPSGDPHGQGEDALGTITRLRLTATSLVPVEHVGERLAFARRDATILPLDVTLARLRGRFGGDRVVTPVRHEDPRPEGRGVFRPVTTQPPSAAAAHESGHVSERATGVAPSPSLRERLRAPSASVGAVILSRAPVPGDPWPLRSSSDPRRKRVVREVSPPERVVGGWWNEPFELVYRWAVADDGVRALFVRAAEQGGYRLVGVAD